jgi:uncharacterized protein YdhG (YjbR/CyaY superfamily)
MAAKRSTKRNTPKASNSATTASRKGFSDEEKAAMREHVREMKADSQGSKADGESLVLAKLAAMPQPDRAIGERLHAIVKSAAPILSPKTWYGMPAYARDGQVVCFFQNAQKFKTRYSTLGFSDKANLDEGNMWSTSFALTEITNVEEARIIALVKKAVS